MNLVVFLLLLWFLLIVASVKGDDNEFINASVDAQKVIGGQPAVKNEFPWLVLLKIITSSGRIGFCGGAIINKGNVILTAAHCVENVQTISVLAGVINRKDEKERGRQTRKYSKILVHPDYKTIRKVPTNDIALIRLTEAFSLSDSVNTLKIPPYNFSDTGTVVAAGWGQTSDEALSTTLQRTNLTLVSLEECKQVYGSSVTDKMMCAIGEGSDTCKGDSGSPLICRYRNEGTPYVCGIVSWGNGCGKKEFPGVYTRVSSYEAWIKFNSSPSSCKPSFLFLSLVLLSNSFISD